MLPPIEGRSKPAPTALRREEKPAEPPKPAPVVTPFEASSFTDAAKTQGYTSLHEARLHDGVEDNLCLEQSLSYLEGVENPADYALRMIPAAAEGGIGHTVVMQPGGSVFDAQTGTTYESWDELKTSGAYPGLSYDQSTDVRGDRALEVVSVDPSQRKAMLEGVSQEQLDMPVAQDQTCTKVAGYNLCTIDLAPSQGASDFVWSGGGEQGQWIRDRAAQVENAVRGLASFDPSSLFPNPVVEQEAGSAKYKDGSISSGPISWVPGGMALPSNTGITAYVVPKPVSVKDADGNDVLAMRVVLQDHTMSVARNDIGRDVVIYVPVVTDAGGKVPDALRPFGVEGNRIGDQQIADNPSVPVSLPGSGLMVRAPDQTLVGNSVDLKNFNGSHIDITVGLQPTWTDGVLTGARINIAMEGNDQRFSWSGPPLPLAVQP